MANRMRRTARTMNVQQGKMYNNPTVNTVAPKGGSQDVIQPSEYFAIRVDTTARTEAAKVILFDPSQGYQIKSGDVNPADVVITGITDDYQSLLNDLAHVASMVDMIQMSVNDPAKALPQYGRPFEVFDTGRGSSPKLTKTVHPRMGIHENQYHKEINTFKCPLRITNRTAIVMTVEPGIILDLGFYQKAELGRKN